jgi:hypothetical protein
MQILALTVLLVMTAIYLITAVATEVFVDDFIKPTSLFGYYVVSTLVASGAALAIDLDAPG